MDRSALRRSPRPLVVLAASGLLLAASIGAATAHADVEVNANDDVDVVTLLDDEPTEDTPLVVTAEDTTEADDVDEPAAGDAEIREAEEVDEPEAPAPQTVPEVDQDDQGDEADEDRDDDAEEQDDDEADDDRDDEQDADEDKDEGEEPEDDD